LFDEEGNVKITKVIHTLLFDDGPTANLNIQLVSLVARDLFSGVGILTSGFHSSEIGVRLRDFAILNQGADSGLIFRGQSG
jgi:hypothetical protein